MYSTEDVRFPVFETWSAASTFASQTLEKRRHAVRLLTRVSLGMDGLAAAAVIAGEIWRVQLLSDIAVFFVGLAVGCVVATAIASASMMSWRLRLSRLAARPVVPTSTAAVLRSG
jgi:hypothetical protein